MTRRTVYREPLDEQAKKRVIDYCTRYIVPDVNFINGENQYARLRWFFNYFSFVKDTLLKRHLALAFYHARFYYKISLALSLDEIKSLGVVKYQTIQYVSICEALLDYSLNFYFKEELNNQFMTPVYNDVTPQFSANFRMMYNDAELYMCTKKIRTKELLAISIQEKTRFAMKQNLITKQLKKRFDGLYKLRNRVHLIKETNDEKEILYADSADNAKQIDMSEARFQIRDSKKAFKFMMEFTDHLRNYFLLNPLTSVANTIRGE